MKSIWSLFIAFFRASNFSFGGGPASIPLVQAEVVRKYKWLTDEEFADVLAIANSLPAPIATKMAGMIGYRVNGWLGALVAVFGVFLPTTLVVILLGGFIMNYADSPEIQAMLKGVRPVVAVLLAQTAIDMGKKALSGRVTWALSISALVIMLFIPSIHPAFVVVGSMLFGYFVFKK